MFAVSFAMIGLLIALYLADFATAREL